MRAHVREQVVDDLPQPASVAGTVAGSTASSIGRSGSTDARRLDRLADDLRELDRLLLERAALVEPREQQQVVDEQAHPLRLARDAGHRALEIVRPRRRATVEQLGVRAHSGQRRAQLVRRVGDEAAEAPVRTPRSGRASRSARARAVRPPSAVSARSTRRERSPAAIAAAVALDRVERAQARAARPRGRAAAMRGEHGPVTSSSIRSSRCRVLSTSRSEVARMRIAFG